METGEVRKLSTLLELSRTLGSTLNLKASLARGLEILEEHHGVVSGAVTLLDDEKRELAIAAATGISWQASQRTRYRLGEGITGRVVESGKPIVVPRVSREPLFLNRTGVWKKAGKEELSFVCVPIAVEQKTAGTLGVILKYAKDRHYERELKFLAVAASMIGQALHVRRLVESERQRLLSENRELRQELRERHGLQNIIGNSRQMRQVYEQVAQVAGSPTPVLVRGEPGTGKEMIARALHYNSPRAGKAFVKVSCGALPEGLVESELFGHEPGAIARSGKRGRVELADGGTLFLDEVGGLAPSTQVRLLRLLQEREFERVGGVDPVKVNVRLVAATNKDLEAATLEGAFREDLFYKLNVFSIFMPPLRDRKPDILLLADYFVEKYAAANGRSVRRISTPAIDMLMAYHWPGNVRELENCIERAVLVCAGGVVHAHDLPPTLQTAEVSGTLPGLSLEAAVGAFEKDLILDSLKTARGNRAQAARLLETTERIVGYKIKRYRIDPARFKASSVRAARTIHASAARSGIGPPTRRRPGS